ncbi:TetR family transcriptional regulator [Streptomyces sp. SCSIO 75703]|uniref:TetR family transcriptional regulator n=1 Tax=unclassified Streptomyces TaxID=2593676 RepID=UPI0004BFBB73|nr:MULTISPECIES: TetR family transcriptional regulator [unclassified Streptomyces]
MSYLARAARRQSIVEAAATVVARDGLSAVTARIVAEELQGSPGQIHHHFASTDQLAAEAWRHYALAEIETYRHEIAGLDPSAALGLFFGDLLGEEGQEGTALARWAEAGAHAQLRPLVGAGYLETLAHLTDVLADVLAPGHADPADARHAAGRLLMLGVGLAGTTRIQGTPPVPVRDVMRSAIQTETSRPETGRR